MVQVFHHQWFAIHCRKPGREVAGGNLVKWPCKASTKKTNMNLPIQFRMNPWTALGAFRELHRAHAGATAAAVHRPLVNLSGNDSQLVVTAELPGVNPADLEVRVSDGVLRLRGSFQNDPPEGSKSLLAERQSGQFERSIRLPDDIVEAEITARYEKGVLSVTLPRAAKPEPRTIPVLSN
jgi:HSP20 family protein